MPDSILQEDDSFILQEDGISKISLETPVTNFIQQENDDYILQEDNSKILREQPVVYRKSQVINSQAGAGTGYQKLFKIYRGSGTDGNETVGGTVARKIYVNCASDFGNIQFRASDEVTVLSHWLQEKTAAYALFWVKIPDDLSAANATVYVYYGAVKGTSNIYDTFNKADNFESFVKYPNNPVMTGNAAWEANVLCEPTVMLEDGVFKMWYRGNTDAGSAIAYATSSDGITWDKYAGNPIITVAGGVAYPFVIKVGATYYLYAGKISDGNLYRWSSSDGISWSIDNGGAAIIDIAETVTNVCVYYDTSDTPKWRMLFEVFESGTFYLRYAFCEDGLSWQGYPGHVFTPPAGNPSKVIKLDDIYYCWTGEITADDWKIVLIKSTDWTSWIRVGVELVESQTSDGNVLTDPCLLLDVSGQAHKCYMWYIGNQDTLEMAYLDINIADYINTIKRAPNWTMDNIVAGKADNKLKVTKLSTNPASYYFNGSAPPYRILTRLEQADGSNWFGLHYRTNLAADNTSYYAMQQGSTRTLRKLAGSESNNSQSMSLNTPYVLELTDDNNNVNYFFDFTSQGTKTSTTNNTNTGMGIQAATSLGSVDYFALAKFLNPEPTFGATGGEEEV